MNNYSFFCSKIMLGGNMENLFQKLNEFINEYDNFIIMGHKDPDLDSLGSALGLCEIIESFTIEFNFSKRFSILPPNIILLQKKG